MPPILLLKGDKDFYGELKPAGSADPQLLEKPPPPPNPMSNVKLSNDIQRQNAVNRISTDVENPSNLGSSEDPTLQAELRQKDIEKLKKQTDNFGSRITKFLTSPIVEVSDTDRENQKKRVQARILGDESIAPPTNEIRPIGEVPIQGVNVIKEYVNDRLFMAVVLVGGIYLAGQFLQGAGRSVSNPSNSKKSNSNSNSTEYKD